jgi:gamma-glutamylcyclotransferase (GGCT)/AIG2-like uncharacterized protein YtfP
MATRLATYGSLAPGRANHLQLAGLTGYWSKAIVRGDLVQAGWGADLGFPGLVLNPTGGAVEVDVFEAADLSEYWDRLDAFEGEGYRRVIAQVETANGVIDAWIYVLA